MNIKNKLKKKWEIWYFYMTVKQFVNKYSFLGNKGYRINKTKQKFLKKMGYSLNLDNPKTFNEKTQWIKYNPSENMSVLADKYLVREYVKKKVGDKYLNELLGVWNNANKINFGKLPDRFVLKTNHACGSNFIANDKNKMKTSLIKKKLNGWLKINYGVTSGEEHYKKIKPLIVAEKYLEDGDGDLLDYKIFCSNGKVKYIQIDVDRFTNHTRCFYDTSWNKQEFTLGFPFFKGEVRKPKNLKEMIIVAEKLSKDFPMVRVDLYNIDGKIIFGEMTFTHGSGFEQFSPKEWDLKFGEEFDLNIR